jgi:hypothetical protein
MEGIQTLSLRNRGNLEIVSNKMSAEDPILHLTDMRITAMRGSE